MKKILFLTIICAIAVSAYTEGPTQEELLKQKIQALHEEAVLLYEQNRLDEADALFMRILEVDPGNESAEFYLYEKIPDKIARQKLGGQPQEPKPKIKSLYREARKLYKNDELDKASDIFYQIFELDPNHKGAKLYLRERIPNRREKLKSQEEQKLEKVKKQKEIIEKKAEKEKETVIEKARKQQFAKQEAIVEETTKMYKERIAAKEALAKKAKQPAEDESRDEPVEVETPEDSLAFGNIENEYRVSSGDSLEISIYGEPDMKQVTRVSEEGVITYPFLGEIVVGGLTSQEAERKIADLLAEDYFVDPQVSITIKVYAKFNILGEVKRPGSYELSGPTTVIDAISMAGGFTDIANQNKVKVVRKGGDKTNVIKVPVRSILKSGDSSKNLYLKKGDTIVVPESFF